MKIGHLNSAEMFGGAERRLVDHASAMRDAYGISVLAIIDPRNRRLVSMLDKEGISIEPINFGMKRDRMSRSTPWKNIWKAYKQAKKLAEIVKRRRIDTLVTYNFHSSTIAALAKISGMKTKLVVGHLIGRHQTPAGLADHLQFFAADAITYNSIHTRLTYKDVSERYPRREKVVYSYVKEPSFEKSSVQRHEIFPDFSLDSDSVVVGYFGHMFEWKRVLDLVEAVGLLNGASRQKFYLAIVGASSTEPSDYEQSVRALAAIKCPNRHRFFEFVDNPFPLMAACDVIAVPSIAEPFGRVLIEAVYLGVPFVATDSAGPREIMTYANEWSGRLVPPMRPDLLAQAIRHVVSNRDAERCKVPYQFTQDGIVGEEVAFYRQIAGANTANALAASATDPIGAENK